MNRSLRGTLTIVIAFAGLSLGQGAAQQPANSGDSRTPIRITNSKSNAAARQVAEWKSPAYPDSALQNKTGGDVILTLNVDEKGEVTGASVVSGNPEFTKSALDAVRKWRYAPYSQDEKGIPVSTSLAIHFRVADNGEPAISATGVRVFKERNGISAPETLSSPEPQYSREAKAAKYQGLCMLALTVEPDGTPSGIRIARHLGLGLDEEAIKAVEQWKFSPAMENDKPVAAAVNIEVQFKLF